MPRLTFLSHFVICLAVGSAVFFAAINGVPQTIWADDLSKMTSVIAVLFDARMKETLREAQHEMDQGRPAVLAKRKQTTASGNGLPDDQTEYVLDESVRSTLPPKE